MQPIDRPEPKLKTPMENIHKRKADQPNIQVLGEISARKVDKLFGQAAPTPTPVKHDPAPSRAKYKMQRLWLTPMIRAFVRTGVPLFVLFCFGLYLLSNEQLRDNVTKSLESARSNIEQRPEFQVELMKISGASEELGQEIRTALNLNFPLNSFQVNLPDLKDKIEQMDSVKEASLFLRAGNLLEVEILPRKPVILWRIGRELELLDIDGMRSGIITTRLDRRDLPLIAGNSAPEEIQQALDLFAVAKPMMNRVRGLRRMGERRWDLMLSNDQIIQLPEDKPIAALERVMAMQTAQKILDRDIRIVDMRDSARPIIRLTDVASELYRASTPTE